MKGNYKSIGKYIRIVNRRNTDLKVKQLIGLSIDKCYITSVANIIGTDLSNYKVIKRNQFACSLMQVSRDGKIPIACMKEYDKAIISPAYVVFEINNEDEVLPDYLNMWFMRSEFDREASFLAIGGVRGSLAWEDFCRMKFPLVSMKKQIDIVNTYRKIAERIALKKRINENLEAHAYIIFEQSINKVRNKCPICSFGTVVTGRTPSTSEPKYYGSDVPFIKTPDMHGNVYITTSESSLSKVGADSQQNKYIPANTVVIACIGANAGEVALTSCLAQTNQQINAVISKYPCFLYFTIKRHTSELRALGEGSSTMININKTSFENYEIPTPDSSILDKIESQLSTLFELIQCNLHEIDKLNRMKRLLITQLSN